MTRTATTTAALSGVLESVNKTGAEITLFAFTNYNGINACACIGFSLSRIIHRSLFSSFSIGICFALPTVLCVKTIFVK